MGRNNRISPSSFLATTRNESGQVLLMFVLLLPVLLGMVANRLRSVADRFAADSEAAPPLIGRLAGPFLVMQAAAPLAMAFVVERVSDPAGLVVGDEERAVAHHQNGGRLAAGAPGWQGGPG